MSDFRNRQSAEILTSVYRNAEMAAEASEDVLKRCKNNSLFREISVQKQHYSDVADNVRRELAKRGAAPKEVSPYSKAMAKMGIALRTAGNQSSANIARIMLQGTTMGIIDMQHAVNRSHGAEGKIREDAQQLLKREQQYCETLKKYL